MEILILLFLGAALALRLFDKTGMLTYASAMFVLLGCTGMLILGASVWQCAVVLLVFALLNMGVKG